MARNLRMLTVQYSSENQFDVHEAGIFMCIYYIFLCNFTYKIAGCTHVGYSRYIAQIHFYIFF